MKIPAKYQGEITAPLQAATELKEFCRALIRAKVKGREQKNALAAALMMTPGGVESLLYHGSGSFENYMASLAFLYGLDRYQLQDGFHLLTSTPKRHEELRASDQAWFALGDQYDEDFRLFLIDVLNQAALKYKLSVKKLQPAV